MSIGRATLGVVLFIAVMLGMRWGANALVQKVVRDAKNAKDPWGNDTNPVASTPITGFDFKNQSFDIQKFNDGFLYKPQGMDQDSNRR